MGSAELLAQFDDCMESHLDDIKQRQNDEKTQTVSILDGLSDGINAAELGTELLVAQEGISCDEVSINGVPCPLTLLNHLKSSGLCEAFSQLSLLLRLFLTIPVGVASGERAFSCLNLVRNKFRATTGQDRLNGLSLISIENEVASSLDYDDLIEDFAARKARRIPIVALLTDHEPDDSQVVDAIAG
ncbi:hypothetical protein FOZ60_012478 [Perkinsus olseni]|uniref:HAT C-terminal dimerisation domain-containing protein n=1 Tax=Perkinsus olseni TaxID=32597 RepID=A0A7J6NB96_PEROL|nr:hypothetical protein FOZ60_012478 [Perkinsus olseni]